MKPIILAVSFCLVGISYTGAAENQPTPDSSRAQPRPRPEWSVRVELLMVAVPQEKGLKLLLALRHPEKVDGAVEETSNAVARKEALLTGYPIVHALDGERSVIETIVEKRYPSAFEFPESPQNADLSVTGASSTQGDTGTNHALPTAFETRNTGVTLEVEPRVIDSGSSIRLDVVPQRVVLLGFEALDATKTNKGNVVKVDQPQFATIRATSSVVVQNGRWTLLAAHKLSEPKDHIEFFIIQAVATPIE